MIKHYCDSCHCEIHQIDLQRLKGTVAILGAQGKVSFDVAMGWSRTGVAIGVGDVCRRCLGTALSIQLALDEESKKNG